MTVHKQRRQYISKDVKEALKALIEAQEESKKESEGPEEKEPDEQEK